MIDEVKFSGNVKNDTRILFITLCTLACSSSYSTFFRTQKTLAKQLNKIYSPEVAHKLFVQAFSFIDKLGNSILSAAYEAENTEVVNIASSFILANGVENANVYTPLTSQKVSLLYRKIGGIGNFNKNLISIFKQQKSAENNEAATKLVEMFPFIASPREIAINDIVQKELPKENIESVVFTFGGKVKRCPFVKFAKSFF